LPEPGPLRSRNNGQERPQFGVASRGRWILIVAVVSASTIVLLVIGGVLAGLVVRKGLAIWLGAGAGALLGIWGGSWLALGLTDYERTRLHILASSAGALGALIIGLAPVIFGRTSIPFWEIFAMISPGAGAALATGYMERRGF
jgi:hypothetical protein